MRRWQLTEEVEMGQDNDCVRMSHGFLEVTGDSSRGNGGKSTGKSWLEVWFPWRQEGATNQEAAARPGGGGVLADRPSDWPAAHSGEADAGRPLKVMVLNNGRGRLDQDVNLSYLLDGVSLRPLMLRQEAGRAHAALTPRSRRAHAARCSALQTRALP